MSTALIKTSPLIKPVAVLAGWTFIMELWMYTTRIPAITKYNVNTEDATKCKEDLQTKVPPSVKYIADNYNHLHEQPTVFYAVALALAHIGDNHPYTIYAAWGYTGLRIVHSIFQSTVNKVMVRFGIFGSSSVVAAALTARLLRLVF